MAGGLEKVGRWGRQGRGGGWRCESRRAGAANDTAAEIILRCGGSN